MKASFMNGIIQDLHFGLRMMRKTPGFTVVAVLVLTVAIGGTAAMFSIINAVLLRPPSLRNPAELVRVYGKEKKANGTYRGWSYPELSRPVGPEHGIQRPGRLYAGRSWS